MTFFYINPPLHFVSDFFFHSFYHDTGQPRDIMDKTQNSASPSKAGPRNSDRQPPKKPSVNAAPAIQASQSPKNPSIKVTPATQASQSPKNPSIKVTPATRVSRRSSSDRRDTSRVSAPNEPPPGLAGREGITTPLSPASAISRQPSSSRPSSHQNPDVLTSPRISANRNTDGENLTSIEPPTRMTSIRPLEDPKLPRSRSEMSEGEADALCKELCRRVWNDNMAALFDKATEADWRGQVDDRLYHQLLDFFYCFLPVRPLVPFSVVPPWKRQLLC